MTNAGTIDPFFFDALDFIDTGQLSNLRQLIEATPGLVSTRANVPTEGYFQHPYLLWFVADNPVRQGKLPRNIVEITRLLINFVWLHAPQSFSDQIDTTLGLVASSRVARDSGYQMLLLDELIDNGAKPGNGQDALAHGNFEAARHLIYRGGGITLATAVGLEDSVHVHRLLNNATAEDKQVALMVAAFYGNEQFIQLLLNANAHVNEFIETGFHKHASALHQAVNSGSIECVKILVAAGASIDRKDNIYHGTPLDWARYLRSNENSDMMHMRYTAIENLLMGLER